MCMQPHEVTDTLYKMDTKLYDLFFDICYRNEKYKQHENDRYTAVVVVPIFGSIIAFLLVSASLIIGIKKVCRNIFYYLSLHWLLKQIIKIRSGVIWEDQIAGPIKNVVENDEDMAEALA